MNELFIRQSRVLLQLLADYRSGEINLNSLIQKVDGVRNIVGEEKWGDEIFSTILCLEQINASVIEGRRVFTESDAAMVNHLLVDLESLSRRLGANAD